MSGTIANRKSQIANGRNPHTPAEWQEAVNAAEFGLILDSCYQYGLLTGPKVDTARCLMILERGRGLGIKAAPHAELIKTFIERT
jgi:hypothetical protein